MKFYTFRNDEGQNILAVSFAEVPEKLYSLALLGLHYPDMNALIEDSRNITSSSLRPDPQAALDTSGLKLLAPIPYPKQDIICLGLNYEDHAEESSRFHKETFKAESPKAVYFSKRAPYASGDGDIIPLYKGLVDSLDYECELAVIIGQDAFNVAENEVESYIFGYTILNDVSARNLQTSRKQWYFGKSLDGFAPLGPCILTPDETAFPPELDIRCKVNGELRQNSNTRNLIHSIPEIISELSKGMTLKAGTIIATGTPSGVGMGLQPPQFLNSGDTIECSIEKIGALTNIVG